MRVMAQVESQDVLDKLLEEENLKRLEKMIDALPSLEKVTAFLTNLDKSGKLDDLLALSYQAADLGSAVVKGELIDALIQFSMDQLPKIQAVWPLLEKLTSDEVLTNLQKLNVDSLIRLLNVLTQLQETGIVDRLTSALEEWAKNAPNMKSESLLKIMTSLNDPDVKYAMTVMIDLLKRIGKAMKG